MKKNDIYLMAVMAGLVLVLWLIQHFAVSREGNMVMVMQDGICTGTYSLETEREIILTDEQGGRNVLVIQDGKAGMKEADCPDGWCMKQSPISRKGQSIICLPHRLVIEVIRGEEANVDAVTG